MSVGDRKTRKGVTHRRDRGAKHGGFFSSGGLALPNRTCIDQHCSENWVGITQECGRQDLSLDIQWSASSTRKLAPINILHKRQASATMFNALHLNRSETSSTTDSLERQTLRHAVLRATDPETRRRRVSREKSHLTMAPSWLGSMSSSHSRFFLLGRFRRAPFCNEPCPAVVVVFGNHPCFALSEDRRFDPVSRHQVVRLWLMFCFFVVLWHTAEEDVAFNVVVAFFLLVWVLELC